MKNYIFISFLFLLPLPILSDGHNFESWKESHFKDYPFECVPEGSTPEYTRCYAEKLLLEDWELKKELNNDELWNNWRKARGSVCYHFKNKQFGQGTIKPLMTINCEMRLNSEVKRYCINGEDKKCG